jgi:succinate dehydrogenase / fumarate reductase cytochrome b subunit
LNWLKTALTSSVGKKFVMGITGLLLCGFLVTHLAGNLLLLAGDDGVSYNAYAHALHSNPKLIMVAEAILATLFLTHIYLAFATTSENRDARGPVGYRKKNSKIQDRSLKASLSPSNWMFASGAVLLAFILLHLVDFTLELRPEDEIQAAYSAVTEVAGENGEEESGDNAVSQETHETHAYKNAFKKATVILRNPISCIGYLIGCAFLGWHLGHGFSSAFQSLGINHPKWNPIIHYGGIAFAILIAVGFGIFPLWALL